MAENIDFNDIKIPIVELPSIPEGCFFLVNVETAKRLCRFLGASYEVCNKYGIQIQVRSELAGIPTPEKDNSR